MTEPIEFRILQNLKAALQAISVVDGYFYTVDPQAVTLDIASKLEQLVADTRRPVVLIHAEPTELEIYEKPNGLRNVMPVSILWMQECDQTDDDDRRRIFHRACADVERAITRDESRGGLAEDSTQIVRQELEHDPESGAEVWVRTDVRITYYRTYGQPVGQVA